MNNKTILRNPGIILMVIMLIEAAILFIWWPTEPGLYGISKVSWVMIAVYFVWLIQSIIYIPWINSLEKKRSKSKEESDI